MFQRAGRFFKRLCRLGPLICVITLTAIALPSAVSAEFALGIAKDVVHAKSTGAVTLRYDHRPTRLAGHILVWEGPDGTNGAGAIEYNLGFWKIDLGLGVALQADANEIIGTNLAFSLSGAINLTDHFRVNMYHLSNGKRVFGWENDKNNAGWNFVGLSYRF
jgi:hypothetical protein